jgi:hypothetical protein
MKSHVSTGKEWRNWDFFSGATLIIGCGIINPARPPAINKFFRRTPAGFSND